MSSAGERGRVLVANQTSCIDRRGAAGRLWLNLAGRISTNHFWPSWKVKPIGQKLRQMWQRVFFTVSFVSSLSEGVWHWRQISNFRLASWPQDVCLGPDEGDVGPIDGHPKKRWVIKSLNQEVIPHFKMNVVFKLNPFPMPTSVGWLSIFWFNFWLLRRFISLFVHIGSNSVQHVKVYFSRPDILWKIRFLAVVCNIFNTQVFIPRNLREKFSIAKNQKIKDFISQRPSFIPGNRWKRHCHIIVKSVRIWYEKRGYKQRGPGTYFLGLSPSVPEGDLRLLPLYAAAGYVPHHNLYAILVPWYLGKGGQVHQDTEAWKYLSMLTQTLVWSSKTCSSCSSSKSKSNQI